MTEKYPLKWPDGRPRLPSYSRKTAQFGKQGSRGPNYRGKVDITMDDAIRRVREEIARLGVDPNNDMVISTNLKLNLSGQPRGDQGEPGDPGVAVYWVTKKGQNRAIAVDRYTRVRDNIAAVAAVLEALRAVERHGGAEIMEQAYTGFDALPPPPNCWKLLALDKDVVSKKPTHEARRQLIMDAFRIAARDGHGKGEDMDRLVKARDEALQQVGA